MKLRNREKGFTLIELLIVIAIIGIIAAILIPNLLDALQKSKQKRTVADERNLGTALMSYVIDQVGAASAGQTVSKSYVASDHENQDYDAIFALIHPSDTFFYMQEVPEFDGWGFPLEFAMNPNFLASNVVLICSGGRDGTLGAGGCEGQTHAVAPFIATDYDQDIVWADGYFVSYPAGSNAVQGVAAP